MVSVQYIKVVKGRSTHLGATSRSESFIDELFVSSQRMYRFSVHGGKIFPEEKSCPLHRWNIWTFQIKKGDWRKHSLQHHQQATNRLTFPQNKPNQTDRLLWNWAHSCFPEDEPLTFLTLHENSFSTTNRPKCELCKKDISTSNRYIYCICTVCMCA